MFNLFKKRPKISCPTEKQPDQQDQIQMIKQFIRHTFEVARNASPIFCQNIQMTTDSKVGFPVDEDSCFIIFGALLGTSLAVLNGYSKVVSPERGAEISSMLKKILQTHNHIPPEHAKEMIASIDEYKDAFQRGMNSSGNPFGEVSGILLTQCMGNNLKDICLSGTDVINPFTHQTFGDLFMMTVMQVISFWEGK